MNFDELRIKLTDILKEQNYSESAIWTYLALVNQISKFMKTIDAAEYSEEIGTQFLGIKQSLVSKKGLECYQVVVRRLNDILNDRGFIASHRKQPCLVPPDRYKEYFDGYISYCTEKGLRYSTLKNKRRYACYFFEDFNRYNIPLKDITPEVIISIIAGRSESTPNLFPSVVKEILRFLHEKGAVNADYSGFIPVYRRTHILPSVYTKEELEKIKEAAISNPVTAKRNLAIVTLAYKYALRDGNIAGLKFSEIDFENNTIRILQVKTNVVINRVLFPEVKEALLDYINNERPKSESPYIFLTSIAPYKKLEVVYQIFGDAIIRAGIPLNGRKRGSHAIRASVATLMINNDLSYEMVRNVLGHTCEDTVNKYASLDINRLRQCALPVHEPVGFFKRFLEGEETL